MLKVFCAALPLVARVAVAAPAITGRCYHPQTLSSPFSSPASIDPPVILSVDTEPVDTGSFHAEPVDTGSFNTEPKDPEPIDLESFGSESSNSKPIIPWPIDPWPESESPESWSPEPESPESWPSESGSLESWPLESKPSESEPFDGEPPLVLEPIDLGSFEPESNGPEPSWSPPSEQQPDKPNPESSGFESPAWSSSPSSPEDDTTPPLGTEPPLGQNRSSTDDESRYRKRPHHSTKRKNVVYFANWSLYGANFLPQNIPADEITHLLYAFAGIAGDGSVISTDLWADEQKLLGNQARDESESQSDNVHGAIEQVFLLKQQYRRMKTLLSIGGWTASQEGKFGPAINSAQGRRRFAETAVELLANWGFDGLDIDYEYPSDEQDAENFVLLLRECREALDDYASRNGQRYRYLLTVATPAGPSHYNIMDLNGMDEYLDAWHLMAYDYAGSWDDVTGDQSNVYPDPRNPASTKFSTHEAVNDYISYGIDPSKIILGLPLYGRSFLNTDGLGEPYSGIGQGSVEEGIYLYRDLPRPGASVHTNRNIIASYSYDPSTRELITYDNVDTTRLKAEYLMSRDLGGAVFWEASGDQSGEDSLIRTMAREMGDLDDSRNMLAYPQSRFANIRNVGW